MGILVEGFGKQVAVGSEIPGASYFLNAQKYSLSCKSVKNLQAIICFSFFSVLMYFILYPLNTVKVIDGGVFLNALTPSDAFRQSETNIFEDLFSSELSHFKKYHPVET